VDNTGEPMPSGEDSQVGYRRPPKSTQFRKGASGNPKGRPKGSLNLSTLCIKTMFEKVVINENGRRKSVSKLEAALKQLTNKAAMGNQGAIRLLLELAREAENRNASTPQTPELNAIDTEVIADIVKRFATPECDTAETKEAHDADVDA
jgi:hypothetical protein